MPLHRQAKGMSGQFDGFHQTIFSVSNRLHAAGQLLYSLMVQAIHFEKRRAQDFDQSAVFPHRHRVRQMVARPIGKIIVLRGLRFLFGNVSVKRPSQAHIHYLKAPANAEERLSSRNDCIQQIEFQLVSLRVNSIDFGMRNRAVISRSNIPAAGEQDSVQTSKKTLEGLFAQPQRNQDRAASSLAERLHIRLARRNERIVSLMTDVSGGDANQRDGHAAFYIVIFCLRRALLPVRSRKK